VMPSSGPLSLAILISGRGSNMAAMARACSDPAFGARVACVVSDRETAPGVALARALALATHVVPYRAFTDRDAFELTLRSVLRDHGASLVILAGFMRILTPAFVSDWTGRMLNVHPALLPKYKGLNTHRRVLEAGDSVHGASVHFVVPELDSGPVILQGRVAVRTGESESQLSARVQACEHIIYPRVVGWIAAGRLAWAASGPRLDGRPLHTPIVEDFDEI
jgi:phosphoribosylglycinamide formyltransferase 1